MCRIRKVLAYALRLFPKMVATMAILTAATASAAPILTVECSTTQIRKGESFKIYLQIMTQEDIQNINLEWVPPTGFGLKLDKENENYPKEMRTGSSYTVAFSGTSPPVWNIGHSPGADTREQKTFVFNVRYSTQRDGTSEAHQQTVKVNTAFSIDDFSYLGWAIFGLILGGVIKQLARYGVERQQEGQPAQQKSGAAVLPSVRRSLIDLLSIAAIGFVVLLVLARDAIPTKGWYDSLALGVAVAILSDDQLLARVRSLVPKIG